MSVSLPVESIIPDLIASLSTDDVLLSAPPGAGKSTAIPLALLKATSSRILLLQPRRVVVKQLAMYLAGQLGEAVGQTVGYRIRGEQKVSADTRLEIITEGILTRRLQQDPELAGVDIVLFDEFHERSLHSDFSLALATEVRQTLRDDLRLVVMSATLDVTPLTKLLPNAIVLASEGRRFAVEEIYAGECHISQLSQRMAALTAQVLKEERGDILVFLPTVKHINQVASLLSGVEKTNVVVLPLHGNLPLEQQQLALKPQIDNLRKVILATNIAETSLTIEGIRLVIDSGREQIAQFHPSTQMTELSLKMISQASAEQRKGRAGRLQTGICYRLWSKESHSRLAEFSLPAIRTQDITPLVLHSADWGTALDALPLLDYPSSAQLDSASGTLRSLALIDDQERITRLGKDSLRLPVDPRYASMLLRLREEAELTDDAELLLAGCLITALAEESPRTDNWIVSEVLSGLPGPVRQSISRQALRYAAMLGAKADRDDIFRISPASIALAIAYAQPAWLAQARNQQEFKLAMGTGAELTQPMTRSASWLAVLSGQRKEANLLIRLAEPIDEQVIIDHFSGQINTVQRAFYDVQSDAMRAEEQRYLGQILMSSKPLAKLNGGQRAACWRDWLIKKAVKDWPFFNEMEETIQRINMAIALGLTPDGFGDEEIWPEIKADWMLSQESVLAVLANSSSIAQLTKVAWSDVILQCLSWSQRQLIEQLLPAKLSVPSGSSRRLRYESDSRVVLSVKMQEMYGCNTPVTVGRGRQPVTVELLSPAGRPIQTTNDLPGFWRGSYNDVRKDMKGRYPKHFWPEDPTTAIPSAKTTKNK
ncbi:ATP-dependent helicase HrpB [Alteromonas lipolytica]|uniref:ATP-dependent helicase HrpB n=1 Tax=Alteromonas lipolytica TaxID=1856405 RepID=A0A1E8FB86_9ALTE|nr:ATP-dependent helicase HrpB [Alteromonas lipolytica]OFI33197.1 ATP-dependent helicase HrpB [Alteromonas lipolytica]GGF61701.1 ATP-dependent helicase HrpB [Alteromonas lipolytica]